MDVVRQMVEVEEKRGDAWKVRAEAAEAWHWKAAEVLADVSRRFTLPEGQMTEVRRLLSWQPE